MMSYVAPRPETETLAALVAATAGGVLLLLRAQTMALGGLRTAVLAVLYAALAAVSLATRVPVAGARRLSPVAVAALGMAAVVAVTYAPWQIGAATVQGVAAVALGVAAAVAEEAFFRRLLYGWLERWWGGAGAVVLSAVAFAAIHVPLYGVAILWVDVGAGLLLSWQRWASGSWAPPAVTHGLANVLSVVR